MKSVLGVDPIDVKRTVIEMAYSLIENGLIKRTKKYKPSIEVDVCGIRFVCGDDGGGIRFVCGGDGGGMRFVCGGDGGGIRER